MTKRRHSKVKIMIVLSVDARLPRRVQVQAVQPTPRSTYFPRRRGWRRWGWRITGSRNGPQPSAGMSSPSRVVIGWGHFPAAASGLVAFLRSARWRTVPTRGSMTSRRNLGIRNDDFSSHVKSGKAKQSCLFKNSPAVLDSSMEKRDYGKWEPRSTVS